MAEVIAIRLVEMKQGGVNAKYAQQCRARIEELVFPMIGDIPIADITIPDVVQVIEKISNQTAKRIKQLMGQIFCYSAQRRLCQHNPAADLRDKHQKRH